MKKVVSIVLGLLLLGLFACSSGDEVPLDRLAALETEVKVLKQEAQVRETAFRDELAQIRKNLEGIQDILKVEKGRSGVLDKPEGVEPEADGDSLDSALDFKAKSFVSENLDRLLEITKKLLDKMEQELDEQMKKEETPKPPEGDAI
ncbi:MAG: hypothetical protein JEY79_02310 [Pseudodesulfovibrio sp.]|nr:hypothetical protein [Pseudodesulfovibrio sp.]